ncbi:MAG: hypothetical protein EXX96DRAFT_654248 [Benjaminiella poitrasii]|nr:MAG: hypothetical protein EXX96DRAFT_654248 [Benjaminiella poitrasii]
MEKRELPTRNNFLTEAVKNLLEPKQTAQDPLIDAKSNINITSQPPIINQYKYYPPTPSDLSTPTIDQLPRVRLIKPIAKTKKKDLTDDSDVIPDDYYLKRHRKHELEEKKQKNREKESLRHGYYQQKQLVERIKTMDRSLLQSIVSSIRHRTLQQDDHELGLDDKDYLDHLHQRLFLDALDHLARYEALGFKDHEPILIQQQAVIQQQMHSSLEPQQPLSPPPLHSSSLPPAIVEPVSTIDVKPRKPKKEIKTFGGYTTLKSQQGERRSSRRLIAFGQKLPPFETREFQLPLFILKKQ